MAEMMEKKWNKMNFIIDITKMFFTDLVGKVGRGGGTASHITFNYYFGHIFTKNDDVASDST